MKGFEGRRSLFFGEWRRMSKLPDYFSIQCVPKMISFTASRTCTVCKIILLQFIFSNFSCMFLNPIFFSNLNSNCSNLLDVWNLQEQGKKAFCYQKLFWPFTVWINCFSDLKNLAILSLQPQITKVFLGHLKFFFS